MQFVYFIQAKSRINDDNEKQIIKIGSSFNVAQRLKQLQTSNGNKLELLNQFECRDAKTLERKLHHHYKDFRIEGEWFEFSNKELENYYDITTKFVIDIDKKLDQHTCKDCNFSTYRKENFDKHNQSYSHLQKTNPAILNTQTMKTHECHKCNKLFKYKTDYTRHMNRKNPCNSKLLIGSQLAPKCSQEPSDENGNIQMINNKTDDLKCKQCHKLFSKKSNLTRHLNGKCKSTNQIENSEEKIFKRLLQEMEKQKIEVAKMMEEKNKQINELTTEVKKLKTKKVLVKGNRKTINSHNTNNSHNNTTNNTANIGQQNNINVKLVAFKREDLSFITDDVYKKILNKG